MPTNNGLSWFQSGAKRISQPSTVGLNLHLLKPPGNKQQQESDRFPLKPTGEIKKHILNQMEALALRKPKPRFPSKRSTAASPPRASRPPRGAGPGSGPPGSPRSRLASEACGDWAVVVKNRVTPKWDPGKWKHGLQPLRSISWWLNFDPYR